MRLDRLLKKQGYVVIPSVLTSEEVSKARVLLTNIFATKSPYKGDIVNVPPYGNAYVDVFTRYKELRWILFNSKLITPLKQILGDDFIFIPETAIHDSGFGGWHKDTTSQESRGKLFQWEPDFLMVQVGIYLQPNGIYGGGLDVIPFSHKKRDRYANVLKPKLTERIRNKMYRMKIGSNPYNEYTIPSKAGDMIVFDLRLDHKASFPLKKPIPEEHRKLAIFMIASANNRHAQNYVDYISSREDYHYLQNHEYPEDLIQEAAEKSITLFPVKQTIKST
ncbi:phytanoyl-CoA dioxygenase family protein [Flavitalea antarctica]